MQCIPGQCVLPTSRPHISSHRTLRPQTSALRPTHGAMSNPGQSEIRQRDKDYIILGYEVTTSLVSLADNLLKFRCERSVPCPTKSHLARPD